MSGYLLDTNCVSELVRLRPEPRVLAWIDGADESSLYLSVLTFGEIRKGLAEMPQSRRRAQLDAWVEDLRMRFSGRVVSIDGDIAERWGVLAAAAKHAGKGVSVIDGLLAATALHHGYIVVSRNSKDFTALHVPTVNPWQA